MMKRGVSLVELLLVLAILFVVLTAGYPLGAGFLERNALDTKASETVNSLRVAQINSISGKEDANWGVRIDSSNITLFKGTSYAARDSFFDEIYEIPARLNITSVPQEVVFDKLNGNPSTTFTVTYSNDSGESVNISINEVGVVDVN